MNILRRRSLRWALPAATVAATLGIASISHLVAATAQVPNLPPLTAAELLSKVATAKVPAFSGTVQLTANLGLPSLGSLGGSVPGSITDLLAGTHSATISADGPTKVKVTMQGQLAESSWIRNGNDTWAWSSTMQTAKHVKMPADGADNSGATPMSGMDSMNPAVMASSMLAMVDPTTTVSVRTSAYVAGRAAYELVLMPKSAASTVAEVVLSIDAATGTPLDARIMAKGQSTSALELGFSSITFATPAPSTFEFTPPAGVTVSEATSVSDLLPFSVDRHHGERATKSPASADPAASGMSGMSTVGTAWDSVMISKDSGISPQIAQILGGGSSVTLPGGVTAKLVSTALINVMLTSDGRVAVGAVNSQALQAALTQPAA